MLAGVSQKVAVIRAGRNGEPRLRRARMGSCHFDTFFWLDVSAGLNIVPLQLGLYLT
jgi:hypothetical protein